jgi:hypothetical protein
MVKEERDCHQVAQSTVQCRKAIFPKGGRVKVSSLLCRPPPEMVEAAVKDFLDEHAGGREKLDALNSLLDLTVGENFTSPSTASNYFPNLVLW